MIVRRILVVSSAYDAPPADDDGRTDDADAVIS